MAKFPQIALSILIACLGTTAILTSPIPSGFSFEILAQTDDERKAEADRLLQQGTQHYQTSQFRESLQSWEAALKIYREIGDRGGEAASLGSLGVAYYSLGQYQKAIEYYQQHLAIAREIGDRGGEANALANLGTAYYSLGQYTKAIEYQQQSLAIAREIGDRQGEANALTNLGLAYRSLGQYQEAIESHQQALAITREIGDRGGEANALGNLGTAYYSLGQYQKAIEYHQQALTIDREIGDRKGEIASLGNLGIAYTSLGQYQKAIEYLQQTLAIAREIGDRRGEATSLGSLGIAYDSLGQYTKAIESHQQSLAIAREIGDRRGGAASLGSLGVAYKNLGQYQKAIESHQQSLVIDREIGDRGGEAASLNNLGLVYDSLGQYQKAIESHQQSLVIDREIGDRGGEAASLNNLGMAYRNLGQYQKAIESHQQSLAIKREIGDRGGEANALGNLGLAYDSLGQYQKAIEYIQQTLAITREIGDRWGEANALGNLGGAYRSLEQYQKAIESHQQHLAIAREIGDRQGEAYALGNLGLIYNNLEQYVEASRFLAKAIEVFESLRLDLTDIDKVSIFDTQAKAYLYLQHALIAQNQINNALEISERGRARAFVELLASKQTNDPKIQPISLTQIQQVAKEQNATLVEYSLASDTLYIYIVNPQGEVNFKQVSLESIDLADLVTLSRESIGVRSRGTDRTSIAVRPREDTDTKQLQQLYQLLIKPIAEYLPKNPTERVIFLPQGELFLVPFPALKDTSGNYLIDKHTILTAPAIQVLQLTHNKGEGKSGGGGEWEEVLIVGNPTMPKIKTQAGEDLEQLSPLPGAETEALEIAKLFNTKALLGKDATKSTILQKLPSATIVHFATHGLLDDFKGLGVPGAIVLAPDPPTSLLKEGQEEENNGLLTAGEILDLKLNVDLMVLSACDTGRGTITGDGVVGLSRSLLTAGVSSLVVSLWSVPDAPTAELMTEFYQQLQQNPDKAQALRQAMLKTKEKHPNPRDWAAFTIIGEAE